jgi:hypothetical protein
VGEGRKQGLRVDFGFLAYRELDSALGLTEIAEACPHDARNGKNTRHGLGSQLRQSVFSRLAGDEDMNDAESLSVDPAIHSLKIEQR